VVSLHLEVATCFPQTRGRIGGRSGNEGRNGGTAMSRIANLDLMHNCKCSQVIEYAARERRERKRKAWVWCNGREQGSFSRLLSQ
jgi:hypothetical protein